MYKIEISDKASKGIQKLSKSEPKLLSKVEQLLLELSLHPTTGTGRPECLRGYNGEFWSRRINSRHRLTYIINDDIVEVLVVSAYGHYEDK